MFNIIKNLSTSIYLLNFPFAQREKENVFLYFSFIFHTVFCWIR